MSSGKRIVLLAGPRCAGKGMLVEAISAHLDVPRLIANTTRPARPDEKDGVHYHFVSEQRLKALHENDEVFWHAQVGQYWYGFPKAEIDTHEYGVIDVHPKGARMVRDYVRAAGGEAFLIAVLADETVRLRRAVEKRGLDESAARQLLAEDWIAEEWKLEGAGAYKDFDLIIQNDGNDPKPVVEQVLAAVREFLK